MEKFELIVNPGNGKRDISLKDLASFFASFDEAYELSSRFYEDNHLTMDGRSNELAKFRSFINKGVNNGYGFNQIEVPSLTFESINTNSPLKFIGYCTGASMLALSLSVAIAGGEADLDKKVFKVNSLAEASINIHKEIFKNEPENKNKSKSKFKR